MRFWILTFCVATGLWAQMINAVAAVVNGEPITLYEIRQAAAQEKIDAKKALDMLIDLRLQESRIKELGLGVDEYEVDTRVELIAKRNNLDSLTLREVLEGRGMDWLAYREEVRKTVLNEKLAARVLSDELVPVGEEEIARHYEANAAAYAAPSEIVVVQYASRNERALRMSVQNPLVQNPEVSMQVQTLKADELNPRLLALLIETPVGRFTPLFPAGNQAVALLVREKKGMAPRPLAAVKQQILEELRSRREERAIASYFARERVRAEIVILREPE